MDKGNFRVLIVDDDKSFLLLLIRILEDEGYAVRGASAAAEALSSLDSFDPGLLITDLKMPGMTGMELMEKAKMHHDLDVIVVTAFATVETAVAALRKGAADYIMKPLRDPDELRIAVAKVFERRALVNENVLLKSAPFEDLPPFDTVFAGMERVVQEVRDVAPTDATVLLLGETGTGKTLVAKLIHRLSARQGPFVDINCAAIPETLLESELFGHEKGAFTGALARKMGKFELAQDGSIFLDEISEMSALLQAKLLRVLQEKTFERLGSLRSITTNARVITASNRDLRQLVGEGRFREDLFYRLNVFPILLPPLRERVSAIVPIARYLAETISRRLGKQPKELTDETLRIITGYPWPGNVRELENVIERAIIVSKGTHLQISGLEASSSPAPSTAGDGGDLKSLEREAIKRALAQVDGNRRKAADLLGISLRALHYKLNEYGMREK